MRFQIPVHVADRSYTVHIGPGLFAQVGNLTALALQRQAHRAFIVADARVPASVVIAVADSLKSVGLAVRSWALKPSEQDKSLASVERILIEMAKAKLERDDPVIALGGGIIGDVTGFAAAIYRRGIPVIQCPTTLLAMVDASVGGKTGVNLALAEGSLADLKKNFVGVFHQPRLVIADIDSLKTLPPRVLRCGLAECIKHGLLGAIGGDTALLSWMETRLDLFLAQDPDSLVELVSRNVAIKARIVAGDEREEADDATGGRALLNLGHTFAHAIETISHLSPDGTPKNAPLQHGEAVGLGLIAAAATSRALQLCDAATADRITTIINRAGLPTRIAGLPTDEELIAQMLHDKKVRAGELRLILPTQSGDAQVVRNPPSEAVKAGIAAIVLPV